MTVFSVTSGNTQSGDLVLDLLSLLGTPLHQHCHLETTVVEHDALLAFNFQPSFEGVIL